MSDILNQYALTRAGVPALSIPPATLWRVNRTWLDSLLRASNPSKYRDINPNTQDEDDRRCEIQDIHSGQIVQVFALTLQDKFEMWEPGDILIPEWGTGLIEFLDKSELRYWEYGGQWVIK